MVYLLAVRLARFHGLDSPLETVAPAQRSVGRTHIFPDAAPLRARFSFRSTLTRSRRIFA
jgi:hypothetical protein